MPQVGPEPEAARSRSRASAGRSSYGSGKAGDTITSGIEGAWKPNPTKWDTAIFEMLFKLRVGAGQEPGRRHQWHWPRTWPRGHGPVDAHDPSKKHRPMMTTADLALKFDPIYEKISEALLREPEEFADAFARAWFKLTHRDMGPVRATSVRRFRPKN
jgi:catalase-peroxidase